MKLYYQLLLRTWQLWSETPTLSQPHNVKHVKTRLSILGAGQVTSAIQVPEGVQNIQNYTARQQAILPLPAQEPSSCRTRAPCCPVKPVLACSSPGSHRFLETCTVFFISTLSNNVQMLCREGKSIHNPINPSKVMCMCSIYA